MIRRDAWDLYDLRQVKKDPVQCGTIHAQFAKWLHFQYHLSSQFWSIREADLPADYPSSAGRDDESFLLIPECHLLVDLCATPDRGPYVGPCHYDLSKSHQWTIQFRGPLKDYASMAEFCDDLHWIDLGCPFVLKAKYPLFWRGE